MGKKIYKETYFHHDHYARQDPKIKEMLVYFRRESEEKAKAAVCVYWWIIEDMHIFDYRIDKLEVYADDYRCPVDFLKTILENFNLFRKDGEYYVSDRVLRNLQEQREKSEKAKKSIAKRWGKSNTQEDIDVDFVNAVVKIYNEQFKKTQIISNENRAKIDEITKKNKLSIEIWQEVFKNAKRGWNFKDQKTSKVENKKPNLKQILDNWDMFASDNYNLAPDIEAIEEKKKQAELEKERIKKEEQILSKKREQEQQAEKDAINSKKSAIDYLCKYLPHNKIILKASSVFKEFAQIYSISEQDILSAWSEKEQENG